MCVSVYICFNAYCLLPLRMETGPEEDFTVSFAAFAFRIFTGMTHAKDQDLKGAKRHLLSLLSSTPSPQLQDRLCRRHVTSRCRESLAREARNGDWWARHGSGPCECKKPKPGRGQRLEKSGGYSPGGGARAGPGLWAGFPGRGPCEVRGTWHL